ncbi:hypothetical protein Taro_041807 [Colocasia esculenta]|uniref:Uncharacterized protein n=1 Tax=Colocasia esculenta TaxID=4460 RepID=A0A843WMD8_COLES|nr:hypothetical protein [Colocasia esculenta]
MASRGRRGGVPARDDEQRREERAEQQAPAPQGPVLPPPPPVDYGVFMQGLVQAMQTQAHTQAALQAQLEAQAILASTPGRLAGVSVQTWTPTLILASSDIDANLSGLHAQQSCKLLKQGCWIKGGGFPDIPLAWRSSRSPEEEIIWREFLHFLGLPKEGFTEP